MKQLTPIILVEQIEPLLQYWYDLGFEKTMEVPLGGRLGFAALRAGNVEVMYQTRDSMRDDIPALAEGPFERSGLWLYIQVEDLGGIRDTLCAGDVVVPERKTFYGAREIAVRGPCGTILIFSKMEGPNADS